MKLLLGCVRSALFFSLLNLWPVVAAAEDESQPSPVSQQVVAGLNAFTVDLYHQLRAEDQNLICSPLGAAIPLVMAADGARGETREQMLRVLHLTELDGNLSQTIEVFYKEVLSPLQGDRLGTWALPTSLWLDKRVPWKRDFSNGWQRRVGTEIHSVEFSRRPLGAIRAINGWVSSQTRRELDSLVDGEFITKRTTFVAASVVLFDRKWSVPFEPEKTQTLDFFVAQDASIQHPLMYQYERMAHYETEQLQAVAIPYKDQKTVMFVLLPKERGALSSLEESLTADSFTRIIDKLREAKLPPAARPQRGGFFQVDQDDNPAWRIKVELHLPRFSTSWRGGLKEVLVSAGMSAAFDGDRADFTGLLSRPTPVPFQLDSVVQEAKIEVNEQGTRAVAATGIGGLGGGAPPARAIFRADHPFLYAIVHEETGCILFIGRVADPQDR